jgi:hypothetical protein
MTGSQPEDKDVRVRIRVKAEHAEDAAMAFERAGFIPLHVEHRSDGAVSFWFGKDADAEAYRLAAAIPREWYAIQGIVH